MAVAVVAGLVGALTQAAVTLTFAGFFKTFAVLTALSAVSRALAPRPNIGARLRGIQQTTRQPAASRKMIYGEMRVGGQVVFIGNSHEGIADNTYLHLVVAFASHEVEAIDSIFFNESEVYTLANGVNTTANWDDVLEVYTFDGSQTAADTNLVNDVTEWTSDHKLLGIAYAHLKLKWDADFFPNGVPNITAKIRGKKVYDPRTSTIAYSSNPALCLRDYLTNSYGLDESALRIDDVAIATAANICDQQVSIDVGGTETRYRANGQIDLGNSIKGNIENLLSSFGGTLTFTGGKYVIRAATYVTPTVSFTEADFVSEIQTQTKQSRRTQYNTVKGIFVSSENNWKVCDYPAQTLKTAAGSFVTGETYEILVLGNTDFTAIGASSNSVGVRFTATGAGSGTGYASSSIVQDGAKLDLDMPLPFVTFQRQAQRLAKIALLKSRQQTVLTGSVTLKGLQVKIGDTVYISNTRLGYSSKVFEVLDYSLRIEAGGQTAVDLQLIETAPEVYDWTTADEEDFFDDGEVTLDDGRVVPPVTTLAITEIGLVGPDATLITSVRLTWQLPTSYPFIGDILVYWRKNTESAFSEFVSVGPEATEYFIQGLEPDAYYDFAVQVVNLIGVHSSVALLEDQQLTGDITAPALPTQIEARGDFEAIIVTWLNPADVDFKHVEIFAKDTNTTPASNESATAVLDGEQYLDLNLEGGQPRYYWLRSVDYSNNKSAFTSVVSAIASSIKLKNLGLLLNQNAYPTDLPAPQIKKGEEYEIQTIGTSDFTDFGASANTAGVTFTATRDGDNDDGTGTVEHTSYESNNGELALVGTKLDGTLRYGVDGSIVWNGVVIDVPHNGHNNFTALTNLSGKQGWIGFDRNLTAPFDMSGTLPNLNVGFVYYEDGQWYYDDDSATAVSFNPDSFTGTTTGTDGTATARIVALGTIKTGPTADSIAEGGLFTDPLDLRTVELPENFVDVTKIATQLESDNYSQDSAGWKIERSGDVEFNNITARGEIHATSGSISESVQIGGTDLNDYVSRATGSLALMINKKSGGTLTGNGEAVLVGVEQGAAVTQQNGFITWDGAQVEIDYNQTAQSATFATQVQEQRGFICVDVNKETPFTINSGSGTVNVDVAFVYKIDDQWYYDNNSSSTTGVSFTPSTLVGSDGSSATELVAIGFIETGSSDVIKYGGLFGQPVALELAAMPADALESGSIGGIKISNNKLYQGNGNFKDANTGFYLDSGGDFSLKDKLFFDNSAGQLTVKGEIDAETLNVVEASVLGGINATSITDGIVSFNSFSEQALSSLDTRFGRTGGFFDRENLTGYDGTDSISVSLGAVSHDGATNFVLSWGATKSWVSSTNISGDGLKLKVTFRYTAGAVTTTLGTTQTFAATKTQLQDGNYVYDFSELTRLEVTGSTISAGTITLGVLVEEFSAATNCFELLDAQSDSLFFDFITNQDNPDLTVTGTFIGSGLTYPTADGTNGQVITTDGSGNLSFTSAAGGLSDVVDDTSPQLGGDLESNGNDILFADNDKAIFGAGSDLQIYHDGTNSYIVNTTNDLIIGEDTRVRIKTPSLLVNNAADTENLLTATENGAVTLFYDNTARLATTSTGIEVTGAATVGGNTVWHSGNDGAGSGLAADTLDGYHAAQTSGNWFEHIPKVDSNGNMEIGRFTDWHYTDTSTATYDARSEILSTGVLRHTTGYGYIDLGPNNASYAHIQTDRSRFYFNKRIIVDEGIILSYNEDLQLGAGYGASTSITIDYATNEVTLNEHLNFASGARLNHNTDATRDKIRVWGGTSAYAIGMDDAMLYGHLGDYAMTFQMNSDSDRGWVFLDTSHSDSQGAMSLTTEGKMTLANSLSIGEGQSITSPQSDVLYVKGNPNFAVMPTFETEGKIIISRADNVDREHEIRFNNSSLNADNYISFAVHNGSVGNQVEVMRLQGDGKVGIGTQNPSADVEIQASTAELALDSTGSSYSRLIHQHNGTAVWTTGTRASSDYHIYRESGAGDVIIDSGNVGLNNTNPTHTLDVSGSARFVHSESQGFRTTVTDNIGDRTFYGHHLDVNISGSDTLTAPRPHYGLYLDVDSSATGGDTSNEHRVYGLYSDVRLSADSDLAYASYSIARSAHTSGTVTNLIGAQGYGFANNSAGKTTNVYGAYNFGRSSVTGTGEIDSVYGALNYVQSHQTSTDTGTICYGSSNLIQYTSSHNVNASQARGVYAEVQIDGNSNTWTLGSAFVVRAEFDNNDSGNRTNNGYLFYGNYSGTRPTNAWGLYINNAAKNYISGNFLVGKTTTAIETVGINLFSTGRIISTADGDDVAVLNRKTSDGDIAVFKKDGTTVGSIGANSGYLVIGSPVGSDAHLLIGNNLIHPATSTGASKDASIDIGGSSNRFKELYLSSAVNCGDVLASGYIDAGGLIDGFMFRVQGDTVIDSSKQLQVGSATADHNIHGNTYMGDGLNMRLNSSTNSSIVENNAPSGLILRSNYVGTLSAIVFNTNGSTEAMRIRHDQKLLFGTAFVGGEGGITYSPAFSNGAAQQIFNRASATVTSVVMRFRNGGTNVGQISHNNSSTSYITTSDARLKSNIVDAPSASDDIDAIQVRSFDWIGSGDHQKYGMIAQELQTVAPDAVAEGDEEDDIMGVDYSKLVPMLIKEIQSLRARVAQLEDDE